MDDGADEKKDRGTPRKEFYSLFGHGINGMENGNVQICGYTGVAGAEQVLLLFY